MAKKNYAPNSNDTVLSSVIGWKPPVFHQRSECYISQQLLQDVWHVVVIAIVHILVELTALSFQDARGGVAHLSGTQETGIPPILLLDGGGVCNPAHALCHEGVAAVGTAGSHLLKLIFFLFHVINILVSPGTGECRCPERCEPRHLPD